jgi:hypothetical protein
LRIGSRVSPCARTTRRGVLVLGYQGTLAPDPQHCLNPAPGELRQLEPRIAAALHDLQRRLAAGSPACAGECIDPTALIGPLRERLTGIVTQSLALDPNLSPDTLASTFPVLAALLQSAAAEWVDAIAVFHQRFHRDAARLAAWLGDSHLPQLASLACATSDTHAGGHLVLRLAFRDGRSIYYKPRPVTGEWLWHRAVDAVNACSDLRLASAKALPGANGRYGWVASVPRPSKSSTWDRHTQEFSAWWHAAGATLCLAAHLRMTDLHMANVVATGRGPVPVDAESLGSPRTAAEAPGSAPPDPALAAILHNLLDTGLLPSSDPGGLPGVSGLFGKSAAVPDILVPCWSAASAGAPQFVPSALLDHGNAPPGVSPLQVLPLLVSGYREAAAALLRCRDSLTAPGSPWRLTLEHRHAPRIVLRDTLSYGLLLSESLASPQLQFEQRRRTALRSLLCDRGDGAFPQAVLRTELRELLGLHIPRFTALPGSRSLASSSSRPLAPGFLCCSPGQAVLRSLNELSAQRLGDLHIPALQLALLANRGSSANPSHPRRLEPPTC